MIISYIDVYEEISRLNGKQKFKRTKRIFEKNCRSFCRLTNDRKIPCHDLFRVTMYNKRKILVGRFSMSERQCYVSHCLQSDLHKVNQWTSTPTRLDIAYIDIEVFPFH